MYNKSYALEIFNLKYFLGALSSKSFSNPDSYIQHTTAKRQLNKILNSVSAMHSIFLLKAYNIPNGI
jgi:hypothetical protein